MIQEICLFYINLIFFTLQVCKLTWLFYQELNFKFQAAQIYFQSLVIVKTRIDQLQKSMTTLKKRLVEPYKQMTMRTQQLGRLQKTCDVLRRITRIQYLTKRLRQQLEGGVKEITKTSQTFSELQYLYGDGDLVGIDVIDQDLEWVKKAREDMEVQAEQLLVHGLTSFNQNQVHGSSDKLKTRLKTGK